MSDRVHARGHTPCAHSIGRLGAGARCLDRRPRRPRASPSTCGFSFRLPALRACPVPMFLVGLTLTVSLALPYPADILGRCMGGC